MKGDRITVAGAGILGLWQALRLSKGGHSVRLFDRNPAPHDRSASSYGGAMLAPYCEGEAAPASVTAYGMESLDAWRRTYPSLVVNGTLVVAHARDAGEFARFARATTGHETVGADRIDSLEPTLAGRFGTALYFPDEAHMSTPHALRFLTDEIRAAGAEIIFGEACPEDASGLVIDCTGMAARAVLPTLRGVRGERALVRSNEVSLSRAVRLLHPRTPLYVVPWGDGRFAVGATVIESDDGGGASVRSALELLGALYALHPAFGEAEVLELAAGVRPAFPDNVPRVVVRRGTSRIRVNGAFRHGFLLAPILAEVVSDYIENHASNHPLLDIE